MKRNITLILSAMMLVTVPGSVSFASDVSDAIIVAEEAESVSEVDTKTEVTVDEAEFSLIEAVEEVSEDEPSTIQEAEDEPSTIAEASGICGENLTWTLSSNGTLTISGSGEMDDYEISYISLGMDSITVYYTPWADYVSEITNVVLKNGVTYIGANAFNDCYDLKSVFSQTVLFQSENLPLIIVVV